MVELNPSIFISIMYLNDLKHYVVKIVRMNKTQDQTVPYISNPIYDVYILNKNNNIN